MSDTLAPISQGMVEWQIQQFDHCLCLSRTNKSAQAIAPLLMDSLHNSFTGYFTGAIYTVAIIELSEQQDLPNE
jgi:hypothetical protein